ncbi:MAG: hypothetical protein ACI8PZ_006568 [Myxococcota bacterium]|jgi:hypothetical protein
MSRLWFIGPLLAVLLGCAGDSAEDPVEPACQADADSDGDALLDCDELEMGLDPQLADSDADGFTDGEELDCISDPLDPDEACYACGWAHNDPGNLEHTGDDVGDTIANLELRDQCKEQVDLWDMAGEYHILYLTAAW